MIDFKQANEVAKHGGIVFLGSSYLNSVPLCEFAQDYDADLPVYNRSVDGLRIDNACDTLLECVESLRPSKIFISIGDEDVKDSSVDPKAFIEKYQWMLYMLHSKSNAKIYIVSVLSDTAAAILINDRLRALARETGCDYVDAASVMRAEKPNIKLFDILRFYMRSKPITFSSAMRAY